MGNKASKKKSGPKAPPGKPENATKAPNPYDPPSVRAKAKVGGNSAVSTGASLNSTMTVDDFELLKVVGKGSFGKVFFFLVYIYLSFASSFLFCHIGLCVC